MNEYGEQDVVVVHGWLERGDAQPLHAAMGSVLQGCLMEWVSPGWAERMHVPGLRPYSQHVLPAATAGGWWRLAALGQEAAAELVPAMLRQAGRPFYSRQKQCRLTLQVRKVEVWTPPCLEERSRRWLDGRKLRLRFLTPTSVRSQNRYVLYPQWGQLLQGLALRWQAGGRAGPPPGLVWEDGVLVQGYQLEMTHFALERVRIPAFQGTMEVRLRGDCPAGAWAAKLLAFGEGAGLGIKTALGMGALRVEEAPRPAAPGAGKERKQ